MITKFQIERCDQNYNVKVFRPENHISGHTQTFPPGYRNIQDCPHRLQGSRAQKEQLKQLNMLGYKAYE